MLSDINYAMSKTGTLAYVPARTNARSMVWLDRKGRETLIQAITPRPSETIAVSPDGKRLAFAIEDRDADIWTWADSTPRWTLDGKRIVFQSNRSGPLNLYSIAADGSGVVERLTNSNNDQYPNSITPDGLTILVCELRPKTGVDILQFSAPTTRPEGEGTLSVGQRGLEGESLVAGPAAEYAANISPNGRHFAYQSAESGGKFTIWVQPYPDVTQGR